MEELPLWALGAGERIISREATVVNFLIFLCKKKKKRQQLSSKKLQSTAKKFFPFFKNLNSLSLFWSLSIALCCYQEHNKAYDR